MLSKNKVKLINSLKHKKFRTQHKLFIVEGEKMVNELLNSNFSVQEVFHLPTYSHHLFNSIEHTVVNDKELGSISQLTTPNKVLALADIPEQLKTLNPSDDLGLVLDNIQDPGNLGTIIRTAAWFGIRTIYCSENTADAYNTKVVQSTMGAIFRTNITYSPLEPLLQKAKDENIPIYGTLLTGSNLYDQKLENKSLLIMGNESKGISSEIQKYLSAAIKIPGYPISNQDVESLNVGVACAIVCSEFRRQIL